MTVDNEVILLSEVQEEFEARKSSQNQGRKQLQKPPLTLREERQLYNDVRRIFRDKAIQARATLSLPGSSPEQINDYVQRVLDDKEQKKIKEHGSLNQMKDEFALLGHSRFMMERKQREDILYRLAQQELHVRLRDRMALMVTPAMLRARYLAVKDQQSTSAQTDLGLLFFSINGADLPARAERAAAAWRTSQSDGKEIAEKFGARDLPPKTGLTAEKVNELASFLANFIGKAKIGEVSAPISQPNGFWVLKLLNRRRGQEYRFEDREVQQRLRLELLNEEIRRIEIRAAIRDRQKVHVWDPGRRFRR